VSPAELRAMIDGLAGLPYGGEPVDQRQHALQAAALAQAEGADDELVLAALLHDIGRAVSVERRYPGAGHDVAGEEFCRDILGERVAWLVGSHAQAKRYLVTTEADYAAQLTPASVRSLEVQGGRMSEDEVRHFESHPWFADAVRLRRWDDGAKDPSAPGADLEAMLALYARCVGAAR
jgi:gamma-butyrobetaine dioxygenase